MKPVALPDIQKINRYVDSAFGYFGINKKREIARLLFEIAKREQIPFRGIVRHPREKDFLALKKALLARRYPAVRAEFEEANVYLPKLEIDPSARVTPGSGVFYPKKIYIERNAADSAVAGRVKSFFPEARSITIDSIKSFLRRRPAVLSGTGNQATAYNRRTENLFLARERYDFLKECPCTAGAVSCGYRILNIGFGCAYECVYCFLQEYQNIPGIILPVRLGDFFSRFHEQKSRGLFRTQRIGTGEFTDSLLFDRITGFSGEIIEFFKRHPRVTFEFKTKSNTIEGIINREPQKNIVVSWSINPQRIIDENEFYTVSLKARIKAAADCVQAGWRVGFHFDPIIYYRNWLGDYREAVTYIFDAVPEKAIAWISLGALRFSPGLKKIIENRFPGNTILDEELILGFDRKMRYPEGLRIALLRAVLQAIRGRSKKVFVYLCMEEKKVWKAVYCSDPIA